MVHKDQYDAFYAAHPGVCKTVIQKVYGWKDSPNPYSNYPESSPTPSGSTTPTVPVSSQSSPVIRVSNPNSASTTGSGKPFVKTRIPQRILAIQSQVGASPLREASLVRQPNF